MRVKLLSLDQVFSMDFQNAEIFKISSLLLMKYPTRTIKLGNFIYN